jgi:hypothetical protein
VLSGAGAVAGLGLALLLIRWLAHQASVALPLLGTLHIDGAALGWTILIAVFSTILLGLVPGLRTGGGNLQEVLKDSGAGSGFGQNVLLLFPMTGSSWSFARLDGQLQSSAGFPKRNRC